MLISPLNYNGDIIVSVTVSDEQLTDLGSFIVTVMPINDAPILSDIADQSIDEDTSLTYSLVASDIDQDPLTYSASTDGNAQLMSQITY